MDYSPQGCRRLRHDLATKLENKDLSLLTYCQNQVNKALPEEHYSLLQMHQKRKSTMTPTVLPTAPASKRQCPKVWHMQHCRG